MTKKRLGITVGLLVIVCSCFEQAPVKVPGPAAAPSPTLATTGKPEIELTIGDVEAEVCVETWLAEESRSDQLKGEKLVDTKNRLNLLSFSVPPPYPNQLWLRSAVKSQRKFPDTPIVVRATVLVDDRPVDTLATVLGGDAKVAEFGKSVDVLAGFEKAPETILVTLQTETLMLPEGTDLETVDAAAATTTPERISHSVMANPVRINFLPEAPPQP
ncbi:MAG: hypothetical protein HY706_04705 [Candidatus Hydrogenedentes bacterium]|nr:hypothetical protein [Candidatus Hydrogenedentota bacterium]